MIARIWRGAVRQTDRDAYADYMAATGLERDQFVSHYVVDRYAAP